MVDALGVQSASQRPSPDAFATMAGTPPTLTVELIEKAPAVAARKTTSVALVALTENGVGGMYSATAVALGTVTLPHNATTAVSAQLPKATSAYVGAAPHPAEAIAAAAVDGCAAPNRVDTMPSLRPGVKLIASAASGQCVPRTARGTDASTSRTVPPPTVRLHESDAAPVAPPPKASDTTMVTGTLTC